MAERKVFGVMPFIPGSNEEETSYFRRLAATRDEYIRNLKKETEISAIRHWLDHQHHLPKISDEAIVLFLHSCFFSVERTKHTIDTYFSVRTHAPELFSNRQLKQLVEPLQKINKVSVIPFEIKTPDGCRVVFIKLRNITASEFNFTECVKSGLASFDIEAGQAPPSEGLRAVFDMTNFQYSFLPKFSLSVIKQNMVYIQEGLPVRLKSVHIVNATSIVSQIMSLIEPFLKPELKTKIKIYTSAEMDKFFEIIPKSCTPQDMGGDLPTTDTYTARLSARIEQVYPWLLQLEEFKVDESRRPGKSKTSSDVFGIQGSFRKLDID